MSEPILSLAEGRFGLAPGAFPFESRFVDVEGARLHYIDVGTGPLLLMLHGNPAWSYLYKGVIQALGAEFRCVAVDLAGFGLSTPPPGFSFLPQDHARLIAALVEALDLRDATLVAHDWGGPVGIAAARATAGRIARLCLGNTWAWSVKGDLHFEWFSRLLGGSFGRFLAERYAVFVNFVLPGSMRRRKATAEEMKAFRAPFEGLQARRAMQIFPGAIVGQSEWLSGLEAYVAGFKGPVQFIWPENDIAFRDKELARWRKLLPQASVLRLPNCGHFLWLETPGECAEAIRKFRRG